MILATVVGGMCPVQVLDESQECDSVDSCGGECVQCKFLHESAECDSVDNCGGTVSSAFFWMNLKSVIL